MNGRTAGLESLTRTDRLALRAVLIRATAAAGRTVSRETLAHVVRTAPMASLPAAARLHRIGGTVLRGLDGVPGVTDDVRAQLTAQRDQASLHHLVAVGALKQIGDAFDDANLSWVVMKGPVVAALFYPDVGDRAYADLDLLVVRRDFPRAVQVLEDLGYVHSIHNWALAEEMLAGQVGLTSRMISVDLHWHLHFSRDDRRPFALDPEAMIARSRRVLVSGARVNTLDPVDTLLTLAFHAARSDGHRLMWLKDVERAVAVDQPDLDELVRRSRAALCAPSVGLILSRSRALLDADVPEEIIRALIPAALRGADRVASALGHPVQMHERGTTARLYSRSVRSSTAATLFTVPGRTARHLHRYLRPPRPNETDDADEKASYLEAVVSSPE